MELFNVVFRVNDSRIETTIKPGLIGSIELGYTTDDGKDIPEHTVMLIASNEAAVPSAWVQISSQEGSNKRKVVEEGWIVSECSPELGGECHLLEGSISRIAEPTEKMLSEHSEFSFLARRCCTSRGTRNGRSCYVRCCGGCCGDGSCSGCSCCP